MNMNRKILGIALPAIVANITVPLLGLIDTSIAGHLGRTEYIGAIAVGSMIFNLIYWNFGFLRMGTAGMTAQAYGSTDTTECLQILARAVSIGGSAAIMILILQQFLLWITLLAIGPSDEVLDLARTYFHICVWGAPAILLTMGIKGWFIGMQDSRSPMIISIGVNVVNIIASLAAVYMFDMGFKGIPTGTVIAEYSGLAYAILLIRRKHGSDFRSFKWKNTLKAAGMRKFFKVNSDIFLRSTCLMIVTLFFVSAGARSGDITLAVNALIMQLFTLFSYFMDGFAYAGEALVGRYAGAKDLPMLHRCTNRLLCWGGIVAAAFTTIYLFGADAMFGIITDNKTVIAAAHEYHLWSVAIPLAGAAGFIWDGVYIGLTATRQMLYTIAVSCALFFAVFYLMPDSMGNNKLWLAFISYLAMRGISQTFVYRYHLLPRILRL